MSGLRLNAQNQPALSTALVRPERNTTWEVGLKTRLFDRRLMLNVDAFHTRVRNFQATIVDSSQTVALRGYLSNIPEVTVKGVEADAAALVLPGLTARAGLAYARPVGSGSVFVHIDTASRSGFNGDPSLSRVTRIGGYNLTNASLG